MIKAFLSLNALRIGGMALGYLTIVYLTRSQGTGALGLYMIQLNAVIVTGTLASIGLPTLVQRLGAQLGADTIGPATRLVLRRRWPAMLAIAVAGNAAVLALDSDQELRLGAAAGLILAAAAFALTLVLVETLRIACGPRMSELQRNLVRPALTLGLLASGLGAGTAVVLGAIGGMAAALAVAGAALRRPLPHDGVPRVAAYVAARSRDLPLVAALGATGLVFGTMDVVMFGLLHNSADTGVYGAASRFAMLINVALLAGNAQMVRQVSCVAGNEAGEAESVALLRRQVRLVRVASTALLAALAAALPFYAWMLAVPAAELWPYFAVVALSFWLQGMLGPVNLFLSHAHQVSRLLAYNVLGMVIFAGTAGLLYLWGSSLAVPVGAALGANAVKLLSRARIRRTHRITL